jgi:3',5'-cyclic AMP phosphodiesterase CpdA
MTTLRWLHFTDLHIDRPDDARRQLAGDLFLEDLKRVTRELGPWDVVLFTGDLAFSGREEQYKLLDQELERVWGVFRDVHPTAARLPYLLAVPGNHDRSSRRAAATWWPGSSAAAWPSCLTHHPPAWFVPKSRDQQNPVFFNEKHFAAHLWTGLRTGSGGTGRCPTW